MVVFDKANPAQPPLLDTHASTVNGAADAIPLNFILHHAVIDRSGRYVMLYPTGADLGRAAQRPAGLRVGHA